MDTPRTYTASELERLHAVLYEILGEIDRVCRRHGIPYFVIGGTAVGALYDRAILPWDDDVDIGMRRADYERFLRVAPGELREAYFLSWVGTDAHCPYYFAKVKKNGTLFVDPLFPDVPMHRGIFVDIFPFDRIPRCRALRRLQREAAKFLFCCLMGKETWLWKHGGKCRVAHPSGRGLLPCLLNRAVDVLFAKRTIYGMLRAVQTAFDGRPAGTWNNVMTTTDCVSSESLDHWEEVPFGPLTVMAPRDLEGFLRDNYPRLHRFTPEEQARVCNHYPAALSFGAETGTNS